MRALLAAMDRWVRQGTAPPASQNPKLSDGTLVRADQPFTGWNFRSSSIGATSHVVSLNGAEIQLAPDTPQRHEEDPRGALANRYRWKQRDLCLAKPLCE